MAKKFAETQPSAGQSLTELAIALPFLLIVLLGVVDLGRMYYSYVAVANAAREAARYGASQKCGTADTIMNAKANAEATAAGITLSSIQITYPDGSCVNGNAVQVTTTSDFQPITTYIFGNVTIPLRATTQFILYYGT